MSRHFPKPAGEIDTPAQRLFTCAFGSLLGLSLIKFGNPVLMSEHVIAPTGLFEWILSAWPLAIGQLLLGVVAVFGISCIRRPHGVLLWLLILPLPWLVWQFIAAVDTIHSTKTTLTLIHYTSNIVCFYLGLFCLSGVKNLRWFWAGIWIGFLFVLLSGWQQRFGGLEATREYFFEEIYPQFNGNVPEALLKRMSSNRVFGTLFYANTLAGAVLLLIPVSIGTIPVIFKNGSTRRISILLTLVLAGACLIWSGSKAGWLLAVGLALVVLMRMPSSMAVKLGIMVAVTAAGLAGFWFKYSDYLQKGAQSAVARFDYWEAGWKICQANPVTGTGPGTFGTAYETVKRPESEMAQVTHNDYLEQACDSGIPGFVLFVTFVVTALIYLGIRVWPLTSGALFWIWLGLLGIALQSLVEFGWFIPAISWPTMALSGWLIGTSRNDLDISKRQNLTSKEHEGARSERPKSKSARAT